MKATSHPEFHDPRIDPTAEPFTFPCLYRFWMKSHKVCNHAPLVRLEATMYVECEIIGTEVSRTDPINSLFVLDYFLNLTIIGAV